MINILTLNTQNNNKRVYVNAAHIVYFHEEVGENGKKLGTRIVMSGNAGAVIVSQAAYQIMEQIPETKR